MKNIIKSIIKWYKTPIPTNKIFISNYRVIQAKDLGMIKGMKKFDLDVFKKIPFKVLVKFNTGDSFLNNSEGVCISGQWYEKASEKQSADFEEYYKDKRDLQGYEIGRTVPDMVSFKREDKDSNWLQLELYGIKFDLNEVSTIGFLLLDEIAEKLSITRDELNGKLRERSLLDEDNNISEEECRFDGCGESNDGTMQYASFVLLNLYSFPENSPDDLSKVKKEDLIYEGIKGHEQFITDLLT